MSRMVAIITCIEIFVTEKIISILNSILFITAVVMTIIRETEEPKVPANTITGYLQNKAAIMMKTQEIACNTRHRIEV